MTENPLLREAIGKYFADSSCEFSPTLGGVNNIVVRATLPNSESYILRVHNNGHDSRKVEYEHFILRHLNEMALSFCVPRSIPSLSGQEHVPLSDGSEAAMFVVIPGVPPKLTCAFQVGKACGELTNALGAIPIDHTPPNPPYYELYKVHHTITRESFFSELRSSSFDSVRASAEFCGQEIIALEALISSLLAKDLPQHLIHGDLQYDNALAENGVVTGVLDFEFVAVDWRAMDLAICLSKYASEPDPLPFFADVIRGYCVHVSLSAAEREVLADLVVLRILSNVIYFVARALCGEDRIETLTSRLDTYARRVRWLQSHKSEIAACFTC